MKNIILILTVGIVSSLSTLIFSGNVNINISYTEKEAYIIKQTVKEKSNQTYQKAKFKELKNLDEKNYI